MPYIKFTDEEKQRANQVDLEDFLQVKGELLQRAGRDKRLKCDKSITVKGNTWFDHSKGKGGYAIDFVKSFYNMSYPEAVNELLGNSSVGYKVYEKAEEPKKEFILPQKNSSDKKVFNYLTEVRKLDDEVVRCFLDKGLIYESKEQRGFREFNNAVFIGNDSDGEIKHAQIRSLYQGKNKFVQNIAGCNPSHSFNYIGGSDKLFVFEAPIDMLSFISLNKDENWQSHNYVALCGVSTKAMDTKIAENNIKDLYLCLDNDSAGNSVSNRIQKDVKYSGINIERVTSNLKDFNEDLIEQKLEETEMVGMQCYG